MYEPIGKSIVLRRLDNIDRKLLMLSLGVHKSVKKQHALMSQLIEILGFKQRERLHSWYLLYVMFALVTYISSALNIGELSILSLILLGLLVTCQRSLNILMINRDLSEALRKVLMDDLAHTEVTRKRLDKVYRHKGSIGVEDVIAIDELRLINRDLHQ